MRASTPQICRGGPNSDRGRTLSKRLASHAQQAAGVAERCPALHHWLPVLRSQDSVPKLLVFRSHTTPYMTYGNDLRRPARNGAYMTAALTQAAKLISGMHREALHTAFFKDGSISQLQDMTLADLDILSTEDHCRVAHAISMRPRPPWHCTCAMTQRHRNATLTCQIRVQRTTQELLSAVACTPGTPGAHTRARAMRPRCRTVS